MRKTYSAKKKDIKKEWVLIDASGVVLGRLAAYVATLLRGKHKPTYEPHLNCGDHVVIINARDVVLTGKKETDKIYWRHTGYPGGIKQTTPARLRAKGIPEKIILQAVTRMIPSGVLGREALNNLYIYTGSEHAQVAQKPVTIDFKSRNRKNDANTARGEN